MPLKEPILQHLDRLDTQARFCGAVNTLCFENGKIFGFNTDGIGALNVVESYHRVRGKRLVVIGAGGAAKAIAYEAIRRGALVTIVNRNADKAREIAMALNCNWHGLTEMAKCADEGYAFLINCTPSSLPIDPIHIIPHTVIMDIGTKPKDKELLRVAKEKKCLVIYGYKMFVEQAIGQFNLWFNNRLDDQEMRNVLIQKAEEIL
jgi:3-dehydroquinate dehydratase/shikimate dehydrogenase